MHSPYMELFHVVGAILCFLPVALQWEFDDAGYDAKHLPIKQGLASSQFDHALVASIAVVVPMICELSADTILYWWNSNQKSNMYFRGLSYKWMIWITLIVFDILLLKVFIPNNDFAAIPMIFASHSLIMFYCLSKFLCIYGSPIWNEKNTSFLSIIFTISKILESFAGFKLNYIIVATVIRLFCYCLVSIHLLWLILKWILHLKPKLKLGFKYLTMEESCCNAQLLALSICMVLLWFVFIDSPSTTWAAVNPDNLAILWYTNLIYNAMTTVMQGRIARKGIILLQSEIELEVKRMFVRYVSHEIRTPLNTVGMGLQLLQAELAKIRDNEAMLDIVQDLSVSCDTAVDILNDLLTYEKLTANILQLDSAVISVKKFVSDAVRPFAIQAVQMGISLDIVFSKPNLELYIYADKSKLSQVVRNLVSNALKFTKKGGRVIVEVGYRPVSPRPLSMSRRPLSLQHSSELRHTTRPWSWARIATATSLPGNTENKGGRSDRHQAEQETPNTATALTTLDGQVTIAVIDSGVGITEENQKRLFKEIVQFNPGELQDGKGSGLGLWISNRIMELHGGDLTVFSKGIGHGCTFTLTMPVRNTVAMNSNSPAPMSPKVLSGLNLHMSLVDLSNSPRDDNLDMHRSYSNPRSDADNRLNDSTIRYDNPPPSTFSDVCYFQTEELYDEPHLRSLPSPATYFSQFQQYLVRSHVLLVDDAPMNRKMLNQLLKDRCGTISEAEDGKQALDMVLATLRDPSPSRPAIDVVIMDNLMPVMDGPTAVREMRSAGYRGIVIGLTGNALPADIQWFLSQGADRVMIKPCNMEELDGILNELFVQNFI